MSVSDLENRVAKLEIRRPLRNVNPSKFKDRPTVEWLDEIADATWQVKEHAEAVGDCRTALACVTSLYTAVQLRAKLHGELHEQNPGEVLDPGVDRDRAAEIARTYLRRHQQSEPKEGAE